MRRRLLGTGAALLAVAVVWACGDQNLFGPGSQAPPQIVSIEIPGEVRSGQTLDVRARVIGNVPLDSVVVRVRGAFSDEKVVQIPGGKVDATIDASFEVPADIADTTAVVSAIATDAQGNSSQIASQNVRVIDATPPEVGVTLGANLVALGNILEVTVEATDNVGLREVGFRAFFTEGDTLVTETAVVSGFQGAHTFEYQVPDDVDEGDVTIEVFATDVDGNTATSPAGAPVQLVFVDETPPEVQVSLPDVTGGEIALGPDLLVHAQVTDDGGVSEVRFVGLGLRGDAEFGTDSSVVRFGEKVALIDPPNPDTLVKRFLSAVPADSVDEVIHVVATAVDAQGNEGADTITVDLLGDDMPPSIEFVSPTSGAGFPLTDSILVTVDVGETDDPSETGVASVLFEGVTFVGTPSLGTFQEIQRYAPKEVTFDPPERDTVSISRFLAPIAADTASGTAYVRVTARDSWGNVTKDSVAIQLGAPRVEILTPEDGDQVPINADITIRVESSDPTGVASIEVQDTLGGISLGSDPLIAQSYSPVQTDVSEEQTFNVGGSAGTIVLEASAVNSNGIAGSFGPITIQVVQQQAVDDQPPELKVSYVHNGSPTDERRAELTDTLELLVEGRDVGTAGVVEVGVNLDATPRRTPGASPTTISLTQNFATPKSGTFTQTFKVALEDLQTQGILDLLEAPDTINLALDAFMTDDQGNCGATTSATEFQSLSCAGALAGQTDFVVGVSGQTVGLPAGGSIADAVVDDPREQLILSNIDRGRLEVFDLAGRTFTSSILVGAEPWGMFFSRTDTDSLYVANSGGTNISVVALDSEQEDLGRRILTPNTVLFEVDESEDEDGGTQFSQPRFFDFSDRPQFIAQDQNGHLVYSTQPTDAAPDGTIRLGLLGLGAGETEVILYTGHTAFLEADNTHAFGNVDDVDVIGDADISTDPAGSPADDAIVVDDHEVGDFSATVSTTPLDGGTGESKTAAQTVSEMLGLTDTFNEGTSNGRWDIAGVGLSDTTFVAASGDGTRVAIGEGATAPTGRVIIYRAPDPPFGADPAEQVGTVSSVVDVVDLVGNAAERVLGVSLNEDGTFGVARGLFAVYFFTPDDLRLQGTASIASGGAGVALHPLHAGGALASSADASLAFAPTGERNIEVYDTRHFTRIGRVPIRQTIVGQVRATLPFPGDNAGLTCPMAAAGSGMTVDIFSDADGLVINGAVDRDCIVLKLAGPTDDGGVLVVDVTMEDIVRDHPDN